MLKGAIYLNVVILFVASIILLKKIILASPKDFRSLLYIMHKFKGRYMFDINKSNGYTIDRRQIASMKN